MIGESENYSVKYQRQIEEEIGKLFSYEARPLAKYFVKTAIAPILWLLEKETREIQKKWMEDMAAIKEGGKP